MTLWHTEVPPSLRGRGIAATLARPALEYARDENLKVDIISPLVANYIRRTQSSTTSSARKGKSQRYSPRDHKDGTLCSRTVSIISWINPGAFITFILW